MKERILFYGITLILGTVLLTGCQKKDSEASGSHFIYKRAPEENIVAKINGKPITNKELLAGIDSEVYEEEMKLYEIKYNQLRALILKHFMENDPHYKGDNDKFLKDYVAIGLSVSDKEVDAFVKERKIPKGHLNNQLKGRIQSFLLQDKKRKAIDRWVDEKSARHPVEIYLEKPARPVRDVPVGDSPFVGAKDAKVTIVEFSDFQCPFCSRGADVMNEVKKKYGKKVKIAFKNFPLPFHKDAPLAAEAALCAESLKAGSFWKMHDLMFADQQGLKESELVAKAKKTGIDEAAFKKCLKSHQFKKVIDADIKLGKKVGVKSTPSFFVNGKLVNGAQPLKVFSEIIDEGLSQKK